MATLALKSPHWSLKKLYPLYLTIKLNCNWALLCLLDRSLVKLTFLSAVRVTTNGAPAEIVTCAAMAVKNFLMYHPSLRCALYAVRLLHCNYVTYPFLMDTRYPARTENLWETFGCQAAHGPLPPLGTCLFRKASSRLAASFATAFAVRAFVAETLTWSARRLTPSWLRSSACVAAGGDTSSSAKTTGNRPSMRRISTRCLSWQLHRQQLRRLCRLRAQLR